jgi:hypothetical protein
MRHASAKSPPFAGLRSNSPGCREPAPQLAVLRAVADQLRSRRSCLIACEAVFPDRFVNGIAVFLKLGFQLVEPVELRLLIRARGRFRGRTVRLCSQADSHGENSDDDGRQS